jgi:hypothetical protein
MNYTWVPPTLCGGFAPQANLRTIARVQMRIEHSNFRSGVHGIALWPLCSPPLRVVE